MLLGHGVMDGDEMLVLHIFNGNGVVLIGLLRFQRRQADAAAADHRTAGAVDDITTEGADTELAPQQIGRDVSVDDGLSVHQLDDRDPQGLGQGLEQNDIRQTLGGLPLGNGLTADADLLTQLRLGHPPFLPKTADGGAGHIMVHGQHFLSKKAYHEKRPAATCAS